MAKAPVQSIFQKEIHPFYQAGVAVLMNVLGVLLMKGIVSKGSEVANGVVLWEVSFSVLLGFMLFNSVFSIQYDNRTKYFRDSIFAFLLVAGLGGLLAHHISGVSMDEAGSFRWMYICFTFTYLVFISIVNLMRKLMDVAKKQDARLRGEEPTVPSKRNRTQ